MNSALEQLRVLHANWSGGLAGSERLVAELARYQRASYGWLAEVMLCQFSGPFVRFMKEAGVPCIDGGLRGGGDMRQFRRIRGILRQFDILHMHHQTPVVALAAASGHMPTVYTEHGLWKSAMTGPGPIVKRAVMWAFLRRRHVLVAANSSWTCRDMVPFFGLPESSIEVVEIGIDPAEYMRTVDRTEAIELRHSLGFRDETLVVGSLGRLDAVKRVDRILRAAAIAGQETPIAVLIVGEGPELKNLQSLSVDLGIVDRVRFVGRQADPGPYYGAMDIFCLPSAGEPFGLVVVEALVAGLLVTAFKDAGGACEIVEASERGILLENAEELASALRRLGKSFSGPRAESSGSLPPRFRLERMASRYRELYGIMLAHKVGSSDRAV